MLGALRLLSSLSILALIIFAILAPTISVLQASDVDGMVYVVIPRSFVSWLESQGYSLGSLFVAMISPSDYEGYSHWLRDVVGRRLELDFRRVARSWLNFYQSDEGRKSLQTSPPIPTISITITLSRDTGDRVLECIAHYTYSTIDYFVEKGLSLREAVESTRRDPLAHLRRPLVITLAPRMPKGEFKPTCADITPAVEDMKKAMDRIIGVARENTDIMETLGTTLQSTCPEYFTSIWWTSLYESRDNPPEGWMKNIYRVDGKQIPDERKRDAWRAYATNYSKAYYYRVGTFTLDQAKAYTLYELALRRSWVLVDLKEGLHFMDSWIDKIFKALYGPETVVPMYAWKDYPESNPSAITEWSDYQAYFGMRMENPNKKPFVGTGSFVIVESSYYKHGVTILGFYLLGTESLTINIPVNFDVFVKDTVIKSYVGIKTSYKYVGEGFILRLDVSRVWASFGGVSCEYWRVIPVNGIVPVYGVKMNLSDAKRFPDSEPPFYGNVLYSATLDTVNATYVSNVKAGTILYTESNSDIARIASDPNLASIVANLFSNALDYVFKNLACELSKPACLFFSLIAGSFVSYAYEDLHNIAVSYRFTLWTSNNVDYARIWIDKVTLRYANNTYVSLGWRPLMVEFRVYIDLGGGAPPCYKYCPYRTEGEGASR